MTVAELKKYKESLYSSLSKELADFEKNFLFVSVGLLAFSITFIKDVIGADSVEQLYLLYVSWFLTILSVGIIMLSFLISSHASDALWQLVDDFMKKNNLLDDLQELSNEEYSNIKDQVDSKAISSKKKLKAMRYVAVCSFILGLVMLALFVTSNLGTA